MAKRFDYYAGYPGQQRTPKWVGVTLGSIFGGLTIFALALAIRMVLPARSAEASIAQKPVQADSVPLVAAQPIAPAAAPVVAAAIEQDDDAAAPSRRHHVRGKHRHGKGGKIALMSSHGHGKTAKGAKVVANIATPKYKKAQAYAKNVSSNRRDKKARADLDKMLGL